MTALLFGLPCKSGSRWALRGRPDRVDLSELVASEIDLRHSGDGWYGLCPFHSERTPSFHVSNDLYHCFGCGVGGDIIDYVRRRHGMGYSEALKYIGRDETPVTRRAKQIRQEDKRRERNERQEKINTANALMLITGLAGELAKRRKDKAGYEMFQRQWQMLEGWEGCPLEVVEKGTELVERYK